MSFGFDLIDEVAEFMQARIMLSAADLDLFTELEQKPRSAPDLAADLGLDTHATTRVLDCLVVTGVLAKTGGCYCLTDRGAPLSSLHPASILPMIVPITCRGRDGPCGDRHRRPDRSVTALLRRGLRT